MYNESFNTRKRHRQKLKLECTIQGDVNRTPGFLLDISELGLNVQLEEDITLERDTEISVCSEESGHLHGKVVWQKENVIGIELETSSNSYAQTLAVVRAAQAGLYDEA